MGLEQLEQRRLISFAKSFLDSLMELKTEEADSPLSQLRDSLLSEVESINFKIGDRASIKKFQILDLAPIFGELRKSLLSAFKNISEDDSQRSQLIFERLQSLQLCRYFQYLDALFIRKRNYRLPPSQLRDLDRLRDPSQANKLYLYFWHSYGRITYTLYEIKLPNPIYYPPTKATQDAEIRNPSRLYPILELETSKYPDGMCCVQLSSGLYFFGGKFNIDNPFIGEDEKAKFMNGTRNVLPRDVYVFNFNLYNNCPHSLGRSKKDMLFQLAPMNYGKASPQAFVVCRGASELIFVLGSGTDDLVDRDLAHFEVYDASVDRWTVLPNPPFRRVCSTWMGNAVVGREAFLVGMLHGHRQVFCFDIEASCWTYRVNVLDCLYLQIFSEKTVFVKNGFYGCYRNTVVKLAVTENEFIQKTADVFKEEEEEEEEVEEEGGGEEDEFQQVARLLCNCKRLRMVSKEKGMDAIYNVPRQLQSSTTLLHLGNDYFCYVRTGNPIHNDIEDDEDCPSNRYHPASIVIFDTAPREIYEENIARFFRAQFVYSKHYKIYARFGEDVFIKGCYALDPLGEYSTELFIKGWYALG